MQRVEVDTGESGYDIYIGSMVDRTSVGISLEHD